MLKALLGGIAEAAIGKLAPSVVGYYQKKRELEQEVELEKLRGKREWEKQKSVRAENSEGRDAEWELEQIRNSGWKDEWVLILLSIPLIMVFVPGLEDDALQGFNNLEKTPDWYRWLILMVFGAVYGIRLWRRKV